MVEIDILFYAGAKQLVFENMDLYDIEKPNNDRCNST